MPLQETPKAEIKQEMGKFKRGGLHSGSARGKIVTNRKQAIAIALSQARKVKGGGAGRSMRGGR
jgi:hypothetical protein